MLLWWMLWATTDTEAAASIVYAGPPRSVRCSYTNTPPRIPPCASVCAENLDAMVDARNGENGFKGVRLYDVNRLPITFEDGDEFGRYAVPDEQVPVVGAGDYVFVVLADEVDIFDGLLGPLARSLTSL